MYHQHVLIGREKNVVKQQTFARRAVVNTAVVGQLVELWQHPSRAVVPPGQETPRSFHRAELVLIPHEAVHIEMQDYELDHVCWGDGNTLLKGNNTSSPYTCSFSEHKP